MLPIVSGGVPDTDPNAALRFLEWLDPRAKTFNLRSFAEAAGAKGAARKHDDTPLDRIPSLLDICAKEKRGLFVAVNAGGQQDAAISRTRALFLDLDDKAFPSPDACKEAALSAYQGALFRDCVPEGYPVGSCVVRSGGGWHVYWMLTDLIPVDRFKPIQRAMAAKFSGDPAVCNASRVMRLPGSLHWKTGEPIAVALRGSPDHDGSPRRYCADDLLCRLGIAHPAPQAQHAPAFVGRALTTETEAELRAALGRLDKRHPEAVHDRRQWLRVLAALKAHDLPDAVMEPIARAWSERSPKFDPARWSVDWQSLRVEGGVTPATLYYLAGQAEDDCPEFGTDDGLACRFVSWLDGRAMHARSQWYAWNGAYWKPDDYAVERWLKEFADNLHRRMTREHMDAVREAAGHGGKDATKATARRLKAAEGLLQQRKQGDVLRAAAVFLAQDAATLDSKHDLLAVPNGTVDLKTGELLPADAKHRFTRCTGVAYAPDTAAPRWERFMTEVFAGEHEVIEYVQRWIGYCLTGEMAEEAMGVWFGTGANGKSVLIDTLAHVFGSFAATSDPSLLVDKSKGAGAATPELAFLPGCRMTYVNESRAGDRLNDGQVKRLVSTEKMTARPLYGGQFEFYSTTKIVLRTNHKPTVQDGTEGMWRRLHLLPFDQTFTGERRDPRLLETLRAEAEGILAWAIRGAVEWYDKGLCPPQVVRAATEAYRGDSDNLAEWLSARTEKGGRTSTRDLLADYVRYAGLRMPPTTRHFAQMLKERGLEQARIADNRGFKLTLRPEEAEGFA